MPVTDIEPETQEEEKEPEEEPELADITLILTDKIEVKDNETPRHAAKRIAARYQGLLNGRGFKNVEINVPEDPVNE